MQNLLKLTFLRKISFSIISVLLLFPVSGYAQLTGDVYIGSGETYTTITGAVAALNSSGFSGHLKFIIKDGTYNEQVEINAFANSDENNTITFTSQSGDSTAVILTYESGSINNYIIRLNGTDYITFEELTFWGLHTSYTHAIDITGTAQNITVRNCELRSNGASNAGSQNPALIHHYRANITDVTITNNLIIGGMGVHFESLSGSPAQGVSILNNHFKDGHGCVYLEQNNSPKIISNVVENNSRGGFTLDHCDGEIIVMNNKIDVDQSNALTFTSCNGGAPPLGTPGNISNNFITVHGEVKGIYVNQSTYQNIFHNSVNMLGTTALNPRALHVIGGSGNIIKNNIFANRHNGYACYISSPGAGTEIDYNNYYSPANFPYYWNGNYATLDEFQTASAMDAHSQETYPNYSSDIDLHTLAPWLNDKGDYNSDFSGDIDDISRSDPPDIGAAEFTPLAGTTTPLSGSYEIGSNPYNTFGDAIEDLLLKGINGPVIFDVSSGQYNEQLIIPDIPGASTQNTITFRSFTGNPDDVVLYYNDATIGKNYVILMKGADHWRFENLTFRANTSASASYGRVFHLFAGTDNFVLSNCLLIGSPVNNSAADELAVVYSHLSAYNSRVFENNLFQHGSYGFFDENHHSLPLLKGLELTDNEFKESYNALFLDYHEAPKITGNYIHETDGMGIHLAHASGEIEILSNQVLVNSSSALYLESCDGSGDRGLVANNFIHSGGNSTAHGMRVYNTDNFDFYYNSVSVTSTHATEGRTLYLTVGQNLNFINNIFSNSGGGYVYYIDSPSAINNTDYNDLHGTGAILAKWDGDQADFAALQSAGGMEANSISANPQFVSQTDLHASAAELDGAAQHLAAVPTDIDGQPRHPSTPDIGADEFMFGPNNPPTVISAIADVSYPEDSGPHTTVADLNTVFSDPDAGDYLIFSAHSDNQAIAASITSPALIIHSQTNYFGNANIIVTATDFAGNTASDTFQVTFTPLNDPPVAINDITSSGANHPFIISILVNDYDVDGDPLTITTLTQGTHGTTSINIGDTTITFTPDNGFLGEDSFTYDISDGNGGTDQAVVIVTITNLFELVAVNIPDISHGIGIWGDYDQDGDLDILVAGTDVSGNNLLRIYRNTDGYFAITSNLTGITPGNAAAAAWGDYDNDGDLDILITGYDTFPNKVSKIYRNDIQTFTEVTAGLSGVSDGSVDWGDYDNDGDQDILLTGLDGSGNETAKIFRNDGPGAENTWNFTEISTTLPGIQKGSAVWGDYDKDGDPDILLSGQSNGGIAEVFRNDQGIFTDINAGLAPVAGAAAWADYDSDGDLDIIINGTNESLDPQCDIYQNTDGTFSNISAGLTGLKNGSASWGDYDNDGDPDICLTGTDSENTPSTLLYDNLGNNTFSEGSIALPGVVFSSASWGDYDNDGKLDILIIGYQYEEPNVFTALYKNYLPSANTPPTPPVLLTAQVADSSATLRWNPATDAQAASSGLSYNLRIGEIEGGSQIMSASSNTDGYRQIVKLGNVSQDTSWTVSGLTPGRLYYWSVQAVDAAYAGSAFADGIFSTISPYIEEIFTGIPGMINAAAAWGDYDDDGDLDFIMAGNQDETITCEFFNNDNGNFTIVGHDFPDANLAMLEWIDYDNDGDLDLFYAGTPQAGAKFARVYNNNDGTFTNIEADFGALSSANAVYAADWGDYDNDGDLDLVISGHYNNPLTKVFENTGGTFSDADIDLVGVANGMVSWIDYDIDGDLDIFIAGNPLAAGIHSYLYKNTNGLFSLQSTSIIGAYEGSIDWGDYDSDGDPDLLLTGLSEVGELLMPVTRVFRNDDPANSDFTDVNMGLPGIVHGRATWGDFDNNGDLDILMAGSRTYGANNTPYSAIYTNNSGNFSKLDIYLPPAMTANALWADFDNDRDLDFLIMGADENNLYYTRLFKNKTEAANTRPSIPAGLTAEATDDALIFNWNSSQDDQTAATGLNYNIRIGTTPGGSEIMSAMANTSGIRKIVQHGNAGQRNTWTLNNFEPGLFYYWSIQSIDNSFIGSSFSAEHSFYSISELENVLVVTNNNDSGAGSFRQAILDANEHTGLDTIVFAPNVRGSIILNSNLMPFRESVTVLGPGANLLTIDANGTGYVLRCEPATERKTITLKDLTIKGGNYAFAGPGIYSYQDTLFISSCVFTDNINTGSSSGGAIVNIEGKTVIYNTTINNNQASGGSGILAQGGELFLFGCTISNNSVNVDPSTGGGGIFTTAETEIINCTISGNHHPNYGGGIYANAGTLELKYVTITDNSANIGGGVYCYTQSDLYATHTIIGGNTAETSSPDIAATLNSGGYNLIQDIYGTVISGNTTGNILGSDPLLDYLASNGGETKTHVLLAGSPAVDAGKPGAGIPWDQRGIQRPQDGNGDESFICDIGAVENMKDVDDDGMPDYEEFGPEGDNVYYDGNDDGTPDNLQDNVASFFNYDRTKYITLEDLIGSSLIGVRVIDYPEADEDDPSNQNPYCWFLPGGTWYCGPWGWGTWGLKVSYSKMKDKTQTTNPAATATSCRLYLPQGTNPDSYLMYGPTPKIPYDHFYDFVYDGKTGAVISGDTITLHFIDGLRGDDDLTANGEIMVSPGSYVLIPTGIYAEEKLIPDTFDLLQNYPNPFNPITTIPFNLPQQSDVLLTIYNILGQKVITLIDDNLPAGRYQHTWSVKNLASGIYFYRLEANKFVRTRKLIILK